MMTTRDQFAMAAMQAIFAARYPAPDMAWPDDAGVARNAYDLADAMMAEKARREAMPEKRLDSLGGVAA